ncbi:MAG TPA: Kdo hydroxylase family protein [Thermoanaerobaculia bacterium]|jgi:hypothetical protein
MPLVDVDIVSEPVRREWLARLLEEGNILLLRETSFSIPEADRDFLLAQRQSRGPFHKNIAYRPASDRVTGFSGPGADGERLRRILRDYSRSALDALARIFPTYARSWQVDYASFRPIEEERRPLPLKARNDLIHVDAFPTRPSNGARILRFFTNIHRKRPREWISGGTFDRLAERYAVSSGLLSDAARRGAPGFTARALRAVGLRRSVPSPYDLFMLRFHDFLKQSSEVQASPVERFSFPPGSSWIVLTDMVSHAVLAGQYALEQTVIVGREALTAPEKAPVAILERLAGIPLAPAVRT